MTDLADIPEIIRGIVLRLVAEYRPEKIILFGSYAYGTPDRDSDIDLLIVKETSARFLDRWSEVHRILRGTHPHVPLGPFVLTPHEIEERVRSRDQFISEILAKGKVLYAA